jgi:tetratricopeptide (TPR) repeat protein
VLEDLHELARARSEFERIVDEEPNHVEALARLADLAVQRGDMKSAREFAMHILKRDPGQAAAHIALAQADIEEKNPEAAIRRLETLTKVANITAVNRSIAQGLLGDAFDSLDRTTDAFAAWSASQATLRAFYGPAFRDNGSEPAPARVARLGDFFASHAQQPWHVENDVYQGPVREHIFLIGFPRSGTTLLEQVLASHPDVEAMEERDCLVDAIDSFITADGGLERLSDIREPELSYYREQYWSRVKREGASLSRPVFVDKMPLNSVVLCIIAKLFPRARILFALRDPRDVILSCFRRRFVMTPQMFELTTLRGAADYYASVMRLCDVYRQTLGFEFCDTRYEDLVHDFDAECRRLCAFAGIAWSESMRDFAVRARAGVIHTPSAPQVARGLFTQGAGQWRRYRKELAPVMPTLAPWIERFRYSTD